MPSELAALFSTLQRPSSSQPGVQVFSVAGIAGSSALLGRSSDGWPTLLVRVAQGAAGRRPAPVALEHIRIQFDIRCRVIEASGRAEEADLTVVLCNQADSVLQTYFLHAAGVIVRLIGPAPTAEAIRDAMGALVELFRPLTLPARKSTLGLWAELFVMAESSSVETMAEHWHLTNEDRFDFNAGSERVEVKATSGPRREHHFLLDQVRPPAATRVLIVSVLVERAAGGISVGELLETLRNTLAHRPEVVIRIDQLAAAALGRDWRNGLADSFDAERARDSLRFVNGADVPSVDPTLPSGVSDVRFRADISAAPAASMDLLRGGGVLFRAVVPSSV